MTHYKVRISFLKAIEPYTPGVYEFYYEVEHKEDIIKLLEEKYSCSLCEQTPFLFYSIYKEGEGYPFGDLSIDKIEIETIPRETSSICLGNLPEVTYIPAMPKVKTLKKEDTF